MLTGPVEIIRRARGRVTGRLESLPILALHVHTACNCRCVMCDIWKANAARREIDEQALASHVADIRALGVRRVMLTGGEPLLHTNLWALCERLHAEGIRLTLVTTGLLIEPHATRIARVIDEIVVSLDGPPSTHDRIRRVPNGFARVVRGLGQIAAEPRRPAMIARCVVQHQNHTVLADAIAAIAAAGVDRLSFLAADVFSQAFNRPTPWDETRRAEIAVSASDLPRLAESIRDAERQCARHFSRGFIVGGPASLWRIHTYYGALAGQGAFPRVRCRAPWISAVLEPGDRLRPCFFHAAYPRADGLEATLNSADAIRFRRELNVERDETCRRCVCSLNLSLLHEP
jgi:MoaA/NifB/PqqE/SkfB family radical SAM enzyme